MTHNSLAKKTKYTKRHKNNNTMHDILMKYEYCSVLVLKDERAGETTGTYIRFVNLYPSLMHVEAEKLFGETCREPPGT